MSKEMKDSGVDWIGEIPKKWSVSKVKKAFYRQNVKAMQENPIVLSLARSGVKIRDISNNEGQLADSYYDYNPVKKGDFLLNPMDLYSGANCNVSEIEGVISPAYFNLKNKIGYIAKYYDYYFKTQYWGMALFAHGKGVSFENRWTLNNETLMNYFIPVPSTQEQKQIADFLDLRVTEIDNIIKNTKLTIQEYKKYKQSLITEAVTKGLNQDVEMKDSGIKWIGNIPKGWTVKKMKYYGILDSSGVDKKVREGESNYKSVHYTDVYYGSLTEIHNKESYLIISTTSDKAERCLLKKGDVLFTNSSETPEDMGHSTVIAEDLDNTLFGYHLMRFRPTTRFYLKFEKYIFGSDYMRKWFSYCSVGMTRYGLNGSSFSNALLIVPPFYEQQQIADYLDKKCSDINIIINQKEILLTELESYKKSIIYECVTGKREVN